MTTDHLREGEPDEGSPSWNMIKHVESWTTETEEIDEEIRHRPGSDVKWDPSKYRKERRDRVARADDDDDRGPPPTS